MRDFLKKTGLIGLGAALGILLSVHFSAIANQEGKAAIPYEDLQLLAAVFGKIKSSYVDQVPDDKLIREAINGMVRGLDPHSDFLDGRELDDLKVSTQGKFGGLGLEVNSENDVVKVVSPIEDTPAFRAGIRAGDLIVKIDDTVTRGLPLSKAVDMMRGKPGTSVTLTIARKDEAMPLVFKIVREEINVKSIRYKMVEPGYGYVRIRNFQERTGEDLVQALKALYKDAPLKGLVLDLRSDPGGLLTQAVSVSAAFLPKDSMIVYTEGRTADARMELKARRRDYLGSPVARDYLADLPVDVKTVPMIVLIDAGSASASEIVAGALQDHQRALLMGASSFGKGSVQTIMQIDAKHALKLTTARYFTPSGRSIQAKGIEPDIAVDDGRDVLRIREANLEHHMATPKNGKEKPEAAKEKTATPTTPPMPGVDEDKPAAPVRFEFGSPEDFQLQQALNQLKGLPVIAAIKKEDKKAGTETAEKSATPDEAATESAPKAPDKP